MLSISACSWLAGIASSAASELLLPFPAPWVFLSLTGHLPVLFLLRTHLHNCPAFAPPRFPGLPRYAGLRLLPTPLRPSPLAGVCRALVVAPHADRSPGLPRQPFPKCHLRRHSRNVERISTLVPSAPDSLRQMHSGSAFRFYSFRCSLDGVHFHYGLLLQKMSRLRLRPRGVIPDLSFVREPSNSTGRIFASVASSFPGARAFPKSGTGATVAIFSLCRHWPIGMATVTLHRSAGFPARARGFQPALVGILPAREKAREGRPARCLTLQPSWGRSRRKSGDGIFQTSATTRRRICTYILKESAYWYREVIQTNGANL